MMRMEQWVRHAWKGGRILAVLCLFYALKYFTFSTNLNLSHIYGFIAIKLFVMFLCGEGNGTPLQYSCLENPMDRGAWWAAVHGVAKSRTQLGNFTFTFHFHALEKEMATHSSVLAWRIPGTGEPGGLPSMGSQSWTLLKRLSNSSINWIVTCLYTLSLIYW